MEKLSGSPLEVDCLLPLDAAGDVNQLYDKLRNPFHYPVDIVVSAINSLHTANVNRKSIPDDVVQSIVAYVSGLDDDHKCIAAVHSLCTLNFEAKDFDFMFLNKFQSVCESTLTRDPKSVFKILSPLSEWVKYVKLTAGLKSAIDKALAVCKVSTNRCDGVLSNLGHLGFTWSSLSDETRVALQHAMNREIPLMNGVQFEKFTFSLSLLKAKYSELPIARNSIVAHCNRCCDTIDPANLHRNLGQIEVPWIMLSLQVQKKLVPLFNDFFRNNCHGYTLHLFARMSFRLSDESVLVKELSKHLDKLTPERFSIAFKQLSDLKIKWHMFNAESQQQLLNTINRLLPQMSDSNVYFTAAALLSFRIPHEKLSEDLKEAVQHYANKVLVTATTNGFCSDIDSLGKMGFKYVLLSEDTKKLLQARLLTHLTATNDVGVRIILVGLSGMGVTSSDLSEELQQCIGLLLAKHKTDLEKQHNKHKASLDDSLKAIFAMNNEITNV